MLNKQSDYIKHSFNDPVWYSAWVEVNGKSLFVNVGHKSGIRLLRFFFYHGGFLTLFNNVIYYNYINSTCLWIYIAIHNSAISKFLKFLWV